MKTAQQLLHILADGQRYSGEALGRQLQVSRAAIWKAIQHLNTLGIDIESIRGNGYCINGGLDLLNKERILTHVSPQYQQLLDEFILLEKTESTNNVLLSKAHQHKRIACFAEHQTHGRSRRGRSWQSPYGHNIYGSLLWHFEKDPGEIIGLSLAMAVAIARALQDYGIYQQVGLKWPNDIYHAGKKLGGILSEVMAESHEHCSVVIGVGINTHLPSSHSKQIDQPWTSIKQISPNKMARNHLAGLILQHLIIALTQFSDQGLHHFMDEWHHFDLLKNKAVTVTSSLHNIHGTMQGINHRGELILLDDRQQQHVFLSGEASLRPRQSTTKNGS